MYTQVVIARAAVLAIISATLYAQNPASRAKATDYPVHVTLPNMEIGLEYLVHSIPGDDRFYIAKDYLVVELAAFPKDAIALSPSKFTLLVNGKNILYTASPGMVAASIKYPDWEQHRQLTTEAGNGNASVVFGAPRPVGRFPGDNRDNVPMNIPRPPQPDDGKDLDHPHERPIEEAIANAALPEGRAAKPVKGCLFFSFSGKTKSIKSLALIYDPGDPAPKSTIPIL
ncbi:MAG TPA: hypothetical protein VEU96_06975 [Bryobacteraceae bacterium]|nr:hypothetical protein [Bryobacteraceae bacterium]